jgi:hypothetical protein
MKIAHIIIIHALTTLWIFQFWQHSLSTTDVRKNHVIKNVLKAFSVSYGWNPNSSPCISHDDPRPLTHKTRWGNIISFPTPAPIRSQTHLKWWYNKFLWYCPTPHLQRRHGLTLNLLTQYGFHKYFQPWGEIHSYKQDTDTLHLSYHLWWLGSNCFSESLWTWAGVKTYKLATTTFSSTKLFMTIVFAWLFSVLPAICWDQKLQIGYDHDCI